ncbi:hypothetical protein H9P43_008633 [Blastocladiella emersonii ATCC 22665]|nr:hypothetical protein H9P43_008633 [Blastocladiella emersonii ATCC 22665]
MSAEELESYQYQLQQIEAALDADPHNVELRTLRADLQEVIALTRTLLGEPEPAASAAALPVEEPSHSHHEEIGPAFPPTTRAAPAAAPPSPPPRPAPAALTPQWSVGDTILAKWSTNGKWYEAAVTAVSTRDAASPEDITYSVTFAGYTSVELVKQANTMAYDPAILRQLTAAAAAAAASRAAASAASGKKSKPRASGGYAAAPAVVHGATPVFGSAPTVTGGPSRAAAVAAAAPAPPVKEKKKAAKVSELEAQHRKQQQSWLAFASGQSKKGKKAAAAEPVPPVPGVAARKSIFATPDNPLAKVGVTGSGRGMTGFTDRGKHRFNPY